MLKCELEDQKQAQLSIQCYNDAAFFSFLLFLSSFFLLIKLRVNRSLEPHTNCNAISSNLLSSKSPPQKSLSCQVLDVVGVLSSRSSTFLSGCAQYDLSCKAAPTTKLLEEYQLAFLHQLTDDTRISALISATDPQHSPVSSHLKCLKRLDKTRFRTIHRNRYINALLTFFLIS